MDQCRICHNTVCDVAVQNCLSIILFAVSKPVDFIILWGIFCSHTLVRSNKVKKQCSVVENSVVEEKTKLSVQLSLTSLWHHFHICKSAKERTYPSVDIYSPFASIFNPKKSSQTYGKNWHFRHSLNELTYWKKIGANGFAQRSRRARATTQKSIASLGSLIAGVDGFTPKADTRKLNENYAKIKICFKPFQHKTPMEKPQFL